MIAGNAPDRRTSNVKLFEDHTMQLIKSQFGKTHSERYLSLNSSELINIYNLEEQISLTVGDTTYKLPMAWEIRPGKINNFSTSNIKFVIKESQFSVPETISLYTSPIIEDLKKRNDKRYHDGRVVRLNGIQKLSADNFELEICPGSYYE